MVNKKGSDVKDAEEKPTEKSDMEQFRRGAYEAAQVIVERCAMLDEITIRGLLNTLATELHNQIGSRVTISESATFPPKFPRR